MNNFNFETQKTCKPYFLSKSMEHTRKEKNGFISCYLKEAPFLNDVLINHIGQDVLKLCDGIKTIEEILNIMTRRYEDVDPQRISNDLIQVLYNYSEVGLINWIGGSPFMYKTEKKINGNYTITLASEEDFREICSFFQGDILKRKANINYLIYGAKIEDYRSEIAFREKLFSYSEEFFILKNNDKIDGILSLIQPINKFMLRKSTVAKVGIVSIPTDYLKDVIEFAKEVTPQISAADISKIKLLIVKDQSTDEKIVDYFSDSGFVSECILKNEIGHKDIESFSYVY
ncbi:PqqD family protein [Clostridium felsineum]|uniref:PqqD family protein n=1 Tax=Clostridium felsineum TaxID=36839 RepID=UPI0020342765|nr:PqqD family protein [Clostridium felsineum]